jgi:hypothetical protein
MSSRFKDNSRFASLIEEKPVNKVSKNEKQNNMEKKTNMEKQTKYESNDTYNSFKNEKPSREYSSFSKNYRERREEIMERIEKEETRKKEEADRIKEEEKKISLSIESFPELIQSKKKVDLEVVDNTANFLETLKKNVFTEKPVEPIIQPGWTQLTIDKHSNNTIIVSNIKEDTSVHIKTPEELAYNVLEHLVYLHEKRTTEYINSWGQDEWERMFIFPSYDYHYFDKLDEIYEKNNKESDDEYENEEYEY